MLIENSKSSTLFAILYMVSSAPDCTTVTLVPDRRSPSSLSGFDVLHDCTQQPKVFLSLQPAADSRDVRTDVGILNWSEIKQSCSIIEIHFPGVTYNHNYVINIDADPSSLTPEQLAPQNTRKPIRGVFDRDPMLGEDIIRIVPQQEPLFDGDVEFDWSYGLRREGFGQSSLHLPFRAIQTQGDKLTGITETEVSLMAPIGYQVTNQSIEQSWFKPIGDASLYDVTGRAFWQRIEPLRPN